MIIIYHLFNIMIIIVIILNIKSKLKKIIPRIFEQTSNLNM